MLPCVAEFEQEVSEGGGVPFSVVDGDCLESVSRESFSILESFFELEFEQDSAASRFFVFPFHGWFFLPWWGGGFRFHQPGEDACEVGVRWRGRVRGVAALGHSRIDAMSADERPRPLPFEANVFFTLS
jgi:hypothetical protein